MMLVPREPKQIIQDVLVGNYHSNEYFRFTDFVQKIQEVPSASLIDIEMIKDFVYEMIDQKRIAQEYVGDDVSPMQTDEQKKDARNKCIRFKLIAQSNED